MSPLTIVTSDTPATLVERLALDLGRAPLGPFDDEAIVVQSQGMARWLQHELARRHGCAASLDLPFPAAFCHGLARALDAAPLDEHYTREALTWRIFALLEGGLAREPHFEPIAGYARDDEPRKRLGLAARIAARLDDYQLYRPDVLLAWERDEPGADVHAHERWQHALWRRLTGGTEPRHLARWFTQAVALLRAAAVAPAGLPARIGVFGVTTLPPLFVDLLAAASRFVPVRVYAVAPPRATWEGEPLHPLAAAFGQSTRELLGLLAGHGAEWDEHHARPGAEPASVLHRLQRDLREGVARGPEPGLASPVPVREGDASLAVHACHSPMREMEVLRDQLLDAFAADATLRPHDVLVLVPDVATYAPFVEAVFGVGEPGLPRIPHHVADRPVVQEGTIAEAALRILRLVGARWTAAEIVELLDVPAIRRAAGVPEHATGRILQWIDDTSIRWGRDGAMRRESFGLPALEANTWRAGIDRLLMGYATGRADALVSGVVPHAGHTIGDPETLGALAHWTDRLFDTLAEWRQPRTLAAWSASLHDAVATFLAPEGEDEARELSTLLGAIDELARLASLADARRPLDVAVVRDWLERALADDGFGSGFLTGGMTVCAMKPMRAIPFRVIAMAGLDDASFPRRDRRAAYDLMEIAPRPGDRDLRADDRQLFLDTICSAGDRLVLSYVGRSAKDNKERASSVVVAELLDIVDRAFATGARDAEGRPRRARDWMIVEHRLQPFSAAYYGGADARLFSYSRVNARAVATAAGERHADAPFVDAPIDAGEARTTVTLAELIDCWTNPSRFYCRNVLRVHLAREEGALDDCEPMTLGALARYAMHEKMLGRHLAGGREPAHERAVALATGSLPSGELASLWYDQLDADIAALLARVGRPEFGEPVHLEVAGDGWTLTGRVDGLTGEGRLQVRPAKRKPRDLVRAWITHVALAAAFGEMPSRLVATDVDTHLPPLSDARAVLDGLVAGWRAALVAPLPVFEHASLAWAERRHSASGRTTRTPLDMAIAAFVGSEFSRGACDSADAHVALCWRGRDPFAGDAFARWSEVLWGPAFAAMRTAAEAEA